MSNPVGVPDPPPPRGKPLTRALTLFTLCLQLLEPSWTKQMSLHFCFVVNT